VTVLGALAHCGGAILFVLRSLHGDDLFISLPEYQPNRAGRSAEEVTDDENAYEAVTVLGVRADAHDQSENRQGARRG
jgi:hypothetical protein